MEICVHPTWSWDQADEPCEDISNEEDDGRMAFARLVLEKIQRS